MIDAWNSIFETRPTDTSNPKYIDNSIRQLRRAFRERFAVEHDLSDGTHRPGSARASYQSAAPTTGLETGQLFVNSTTHEGWFRGTSTWRRLLSPGGLTVTGGTRGALYTLLSPYVPNVDDERLLFGRLDGWAVTRLRRDTTASVSLYILPSAAWITAAQGSTVAAVFAGQIL